MVKKILITLLFATITLYSFADTWLYPEITTTYSQNREYMLKVYPRHIPENYGSAKYMRQYRKGITTDTIVPCHAVLYHILDSDTTEIWNKPLVNSLSPVRVIVANDGKSVVTIDDWHSRGFDHTLVIYGEDGELISDFTLEEISPFHLEEYPISISSIHWRGDVEYLNNDNIEITFRTKADEVKKRVFNIRKREFELE